MSAIDDLRQTMERLRGPGGCPWDQEQTHQSLARCLVDECSELLETIDRNDLPHMREELGDVLIQVVFHALLAQEAGAFNFDDVARDINEKLIRRHPHVFGTERLETSEQVLAQWDEIKKTEKSTGQFRPPRCSSRFRRGFRLSCSRKRSGSRSRKRICLPKARWMLPRSKPSGPR